jgi:hypothetical protein
VVAFALLTFFLMARKDGPGAMQRIGRSLELLIEDLRLKYAARRLAPQQFQDSQAMRREFVDPSRAPLHPPILPKNVAIPSVPPPLPYHNELPSFVTVPSDFTGVSSMPTENRVERVTLSGGIIGALATNPCKALNRAVQRGNQDGWHVRQVMVDGNGNLLELLIRLAILFLTLLLWTPASGYFVVFERNVA